MKRQKEFVILKLKSIIRKDNGRSQGSFHNNQTENHYMGTKAMNYKIIQRFSARQLYEGICILQNAEERVLVFHSIPSLNYYQQQLTITNVHMQLERFLTSLKQIIITSFAKFY